MSEAAWSSPDIQIIAARSLIQIANHFKGTQVLSRPQPKVHAREETQLDLRDIKGQESAKRAFVAFSSEWSKSDEFGPTDFRGY